jgi:hypothetical protein
MATSSSGGLVPIGATLARRALVVTPEETSAFLRGLEAACLEVERTMSTFEEMIAKSVVGEGGTTP